MSGRKIIPIAIPFAIGLVFLAATAVVVVRTLIFVAGANRTEAIFVGSVAKSGGNHGGSFLHPRFSFTTEDGRTVTITSSSGSTDQPYEPGEKVRVFYDPRDPADAEIDSVGDLWLPTLVLAPFALMFTLIPGTIFLLMRRQEPVACLE
jgi:Protein of unknown function (DUF3592)